MDPFREQLLRCVRCGTCLSVCPVYQQLRREWAVARGRVALLQAGEKGQAALDRRLRPAMTSCLLCGKCRSACPNQVDTPYLVKAARAGLSAEGEGGANTLRRLMRTFLPRRNFPTWVKLARALRPLWAARIPEESGLYLRLLRAGGEKIHLPELAPSFLDKSPLPRAPAKIGEAKKLVAVFPGCIERYVRPGATLSQIELLQKAGYTVNVTENLSCCGLAAWSAGEPELARKLFLQNLNQLLPPGSAWPEQIVFNCASCAYMFRHGGELFADLPQALAGQIAEVGRRSRTLDEILPTAGKAAESVTEGKPRIAWHRPCHLEGDVRRPVEILSSLPGASFVELETSGDCCGGGGIFSFLYPGLSERIGARKKQEALDKKIDYLVTECSGCLIQLQRLLGPAKITVITLAEAVERFGKPQ
jgi:glycolate oxidase iron-sulfur subunit